MKMKKRLLSVGLVIAMVVLLPVLPIVYASDITSNNDAPTSGPPGFFLAYILPGNFGGCKTKYEDGETLDLTGLLVIGYYLPFGAEDTDDPTEIEITEFDITPPHGTVLHYPENGDGEESGTKVQISCEGIGENGEIGTFTTFLDISIYPKSEDTTPPANYREPPTTNPPDEGTDIIDRDTPLSEFISFKAFINGYPDKTFRGANTMNREEFINTLFKLKNPDLPEADTSNPAFNDVAPDRWSYDAIEWAADNGIIEADAAGNFRPKVALTRAEMAAMLAKAEGWTIAAENTFSDIEGHPQYEEILLAAGAGVFKGNPDGAFRPDAPIKRQELVAAMIRYLLGGEPEDGIWADIEVPFTDMQSTHWAYKYLALAAEGYTAPPPESTEPAE